MESNSTLETLLPKIKVKDILSIFNNSENIKIGFVYKDSTVEQVLLINKKDDVFDFIFYEELTKALVYYIDIRYDDIIESIVFYLYIDFNYKKYIPNSLKDEDEQLKIADEMIDLCFKYLSDKNIYNIFSEVYSANRNIIRDKIIMTIFDDKILSGKNYLQFGTLYKMIYDLYIKYIRVSNILFSKASEKDSIERIQKVNNIITDLILIIKEFLLNYNIRII